MAQPPPDGNQANKILYKYARFFFSQKQKYAKLFLHFELLFFLCMASSWQALSWYVKTTQAKFYANMPDFFFLYGSCCLATLHSHCLSPHLHAGCTLTTSCAWWSGSTTWTRWTRPSRSSTSRRSSGTRTGSESGIDWLGERNNINTQHISISWNRVFFSLLDFTQC